jgi:hypothetical protein
MLIKAVVAFLLVPGLLSASSPESRPSFSLEINLQQDVIKSGSDVEIAILQTNKSEVEIPVARHVGEGERNFQLIVLDSKGTRAEETAWGRKVRENKVEIDISLILGALKPGDTFRDSARLNRSFVLRPGKYTVQVQKTDVGSKAIVKSNTLSFTIEP